MWPATTIVLCYHAVSVHRSTSMSVTPATLALQVRSLLRRGYSPTTVSEALAEHAKPDRPKRRFVVTFDDGFESVHSEAFPVLQTLGVPATVFVCTDYVANQLPMAWPQLADWASTRPKEQLRSISWDEARELAQAGWEIGSHTCSHPLLTTLSDAELEHEVRASREACTAALDRECRSFAYPQSDEDARVRQHVAAAGYQWACTLPDPFARPEPFAWPRVGVYESDGPIRFRLKASPVVNWIRSMPLGHRLERAARRLPSSASDDA